MGGNETVQQIEINFFSTYSRWFLERCPGMKWNEISISYYSALFYFEKIDLFWAILQQLTFGCMYITNKFIRV